ncbi:MAG: hypothetical protein JRM85_07960 [Nitrososphaerota archaeon]|jgi:hypothetical protein|nr:hypothetical protein [Nitrososphaerota archaeon]
MIFDYGPMRKDGQFENHPTEVKEVYVAPLRDSYIHIKCGGQTIMYGMDGVIRTYATNPGFYGGTFCAVCHGYFPLVIEGAPQFRWSADDTPVGEIHGEPGKDLRGVGR